MAGAGGILALDLATLLGWACSMPGEAPRFGSFHIVSDRGDGYFFASFEGWLTDIIAVHDPRLMVVEAPVLNHGNGRDGKNRTSIQTAFRLMGLVAIAMKVAEQKGVRYDRANNSSIKKDATGNGHATKPDMVRAMVLRGWRVNNDNEADALAILFWAERKWAPKTPRAIGPLFAAGT